MRLGEEGAAMRVLSAILLLLAGACAPFNKVPGDLCNDPTQNYTEEFAYECNQSL